MNKLKVAIANLRDHLGRDVQGLRLLDDVEHIANQLRKDLASSRENNEQLKNQHHAARKAHADEMAQHSREINELRGERDSLMQENSRMRAMEKEIQELREELERTKVNTADNNTEFYNSISERSLEGLMKAVRQRMSKCPGTCGVFPAPPTHDCKNYYLYDVLSVIRGFSASEMLLLGRFVALMAMMNVPCAMVSSHTVNDISKRSNDDTPPAVKDFWRWFWPKNVGGHYGE